MTEIKQFSNNLNYSPGPNAFNRSPECLQDINHFDVSMLCQIDVEIRGERFSHYIPEDGYIEISYKECLPVLYVNSVVFNANALQCSHRLLDKKEYYLAVFTT
jgi:hypothetical protein